MKRNKKQKRRLKKKFMRRKRWLYKWEHKETEERGGEKWKNKKILNYIFGRAKKLCKKGMLLFKMNLWEREKLLN